MKKNFNKLTATERKILIQTIVQECRDIADKYMKGWKPVDDSWPTVEGGAYLRLSTEQQVAVEKGSLEQQVYIAISEAENRSISDKINYRIIHFYIEPGFTGRNDDRPQFGLMNRDIKRGSVKFIVIKEIARIARDAQIWKTFFNLCISRKCEIMVRGFPFNPNDPSTVLQLDILAAFAEYESNQISKRTRESNFSAMVSSGKFNSTHQVLGLDQKIVDGDPKVGFYVRNDEEMKTVEWIMKTFLKYNSHQKTLEELHKRGIKNKNGREFQKNSLQKLLTNQKFIGKWRLNVENKDIPKHKLLAYEGYAEIDLPHGCVIDMELFDRVQIKVEELAGNKQKNIRVDRVNVLAGILKSPEGVNLQGTSAHGKNGERNYYYINRAERKLIPVKDLEDAAKEAVESILKKDRKLIEAIERRSKDISAASGQLDGHMLSIQNKLSELEGEKVKINKRLDVLIDGENEEETKKYAVEYKALLKNIEVEAEELLKSLSLIQRKADDLATTEFDWKKVSDRAVEIQKLLHEKDPIALKSAYHSLFQEIIVGPVDLNGRRSLKFVLKDDPDSDFSGRRENHGARVNRAENNCFVDKMAQMEGLEPPTQRLTAACSTN
jgi:DNA invertase Pin-like site-specific DNA recombinase